MSGLVSLDPPEDWQWDVKRLTAAQPESNSGLPHLNADRNLKSLMQPIRTACATSCSCCCIDALLAGVAWYISGLLKHICLITTSLPSPWCNRNWGSTCHLVLCWGDLCHKLRHWSPQVVIAKSVLIEILSSRFSPILMNFPWLSPIEYWYRISRGFSRIFQEQTSFRWKLSNLKNCTWQSPPLFQHRKNNK